MADYGSTTGVAGLVRHLTTSGEFLNDSKVPLAVVEGFLEDVSAELDLILAGRGYTVPITTPAKVKRFLDRLANTGAAMYCELTQATAGFRGTEHADTRAGALRRLFEDGKKLLQDQGLAALGLDQGTATTRGLWSGSTEDEDGNEKEPLFERDMWDNSGTGLSDDDEEA